MGGEIVERHARPPAAGIFMARAFLPSPGLPEGEDFPPIVERWSGLRVDPDHLAAFRRATGLPEEDGISVLYPHVLGFRLQMALLTHRAYPLPIWNALQIRNRLIRHRRIDPGETLQLETRVGTHRVMEKGVEVDLLSRLTRGQDCCWESVVTYFYRGRFGGARSTPPGAPAPAGSEPPMTERLRMPDGGGWGFGKLTGDYNGIHNWSWYARRLGFRAAFLHPQRVAGLCMARLKAPVSDAQILELWIKGPVFYGSNVILNSTPGKSGVGFGLSLDGDDRAAMLGIWRARTD